MRPCIGRIGVAIAGLIVFGITPVAAQRATERGATSAPLTAAQQRAALRAPASAFWRTRAPDTVAIEVESSRGPFIIELVREWAPVGVDRFYNLARAGYYDDSRFYRVIPWYIAQFGIAGNPAITGIWSRRTIRADSAREKNVRGTVSYAQYKPTDRTTHVFINLRDSPTLDSLGFAPIGRVILGMEVVDSLYTGYGELPASPAPLGNPKRLYGESNRFLDAEYPKLDRIVKMLIKVPQPDSSSRF